MSLITPAEKPHHVAVIEAGKMTPPVLAAQICERLMKPEFSAVAILRDKSTLSATCKKVARLKELKQFINNDGLAPEAVLKAARVLELYGADVASYVAVVAHISRACGILFSPETASFARRIHIDEGQPLKPIPDALLPFSSVGTLSAIGGSTIIYEQGANDFERTNGFAGEQWCVKPEVLSNPGKAWAVQDGDMLFWRDSYAPETHLPCLHKGPIVKRWVAMARISGNTPVSRVC